jgi:lambda family portal protein
MPKKTIQAVVRDGQGRFVSANAAARGVMYRRGPDDDRLRPVPANHFGDYAAMLSPQRWREIVSESRAQAAKGVLSALIDNKAGYISASHWRPRFQGVDAEYGAKATALLEDALRICNIRGNRFDWCASWRLSTRNFADAGGFFVLLTVWPGTEQPALQFIEAHRIGQRGTNGPQLVGKDDATTLIVAEDGTESTVKGAYVGLTIDNGIISTPEGTEVAYRLLGATAADDLDISARDLIHVAAPKAYSESRPAPDIAPSLLDFLALELAQTCQLDQQIQDARLTMIEKNEGGKPTPAQRALGNGAGATGNMASEVSERGMVRFIKTGNELIPHESDRPSDQWMNFDARVLSRAAAAFRWRSEMLNPADLRGAATRAFQDQINTLIADDFNAVAPAAARCIRYFIAKLTQIGLLPKHEEWMKWGIARPPWFEVDRASARIDLEEVAAGRVSMSSLHHRDGNTTAEVYASRIHAYKEALALQAANPDVPLDIILGNLGAPAAKQMGAGDTPKDNAPEPTPPPDDKKKK